MIRLRIEEKMLDDMVSMMLVMGSRERETSRVACVMRIGVPSGRGRNVPVSGEGAEGDGLEVGVELRVTDLGCGEVCGVG